MPPGLCRVDDVSESIAGGLDGEVWIESLVSCKSPTKLPDCPLGQHHSYSIGWRVPVNDFPWHAAEIERHGDPA